MQTAYQLAKKYYPKLWPLVRLDALLAADKLTQEEYDEITADAKAPKE